MFLFGQVIFNVLGIGVDAFRIGAGALLFLSAVSLMNPKVSTSGHDGDSDVAVVPLAMPVIVGPASCGALMVEGASLQGVKERIVALAALLTALFAVWIILLSAAFIERKLGQRGISILMRLTALILAALSALPCYGMWVILTIMVNIHIKISQGLGPADQLHREVAVLCIRILRMIELILEI